MADSDNITFERLFETALDTIREIKPNLEPTDLLRLGPDAVEPMLESWNKLERFICAAKLAIVRDEFAVRFPDLAVESENFSFGIEDAAADRYQKLLLPRERDDVLNVAFAVIEDSFGQEKFPSISHFLSNLTQILQSYSSRVQIRFEPFAERFGVRS